jgi:hypothetical protein
VNATDASMIAARLGIDEFSVRRLQARGYLRSLPLAESEIRKRLLRAHLGYAAARPGCADRGYSGVFVDPDGHPWEVAHNPRWTLDDDGSVVLPPAG